jgi:hypothetical protein
MNSRALLTTVSKRKFLLVLSNQIKENFLGHFVNEYLKLNDLDNM